MIDIPSLATAIARRMTKGGRLIGNFFKRQDFLSLELLSCVDCNTLFVIGLQVRI